MTYRFSYKKRLFYKTVLVVGHGFNKDLDRMSLYFSDGGIQELAGWSRYDCRLGADWALAVKKQMEEKTGQPVVINRDLKC